MITPHVFFIGLFVFLNARRFLYGSINLLYKEK